MIVVGVATIFDLKSRRIPNLVTFPAMMAGIVIMSYSNGLSGTINAIEGVFLGGLLLFILFAMGAMGAGDVKLMAAVGALNGWYFVIFAFLYSAVAGGIIAAGVLLVKGQLGRTMFNIGVALSNYFSLLFRKGRRQPLLPVHSGIRFPYAIAILVGTCTAYLMR